MKKLQEILDEARAAGASEQQLQQITDAYNRSHPAATNGATDKIASVLSEAKAAGANEQQLQQIAEAYNQKKSREGGLSTTSVNSTGQLQPSEPATLPSSLPSPSQNGTNGASVFDNAKLNPFRTQPTPVISTQDGTDFAIQHPTPFGNDPQDLMALQQRVTNNTATEQDAQVLAQASGKSIAATKGFLVSKDAGLTQLATEDLTKNEQDLKTGVSIVGKMLGMEINPDEILTSPTKSAQLLKMVRDSQQKEIELRQQQQNTEAITATKLPIEPDVVTPLDPNIQAQVNRFKDVLIRNIKKQTVEESEKAGLPDEMTGDLIHQRTDPEDYERTKEIMKPRGEGQQLPATAVFNATIGALSDWVVGSKAKNAEDLNVVQTQNALAVNAGRRDLAIEKKAQAYLTGDPTTKMEAENLAAKVQDDEDIIQKSPLLMKQVMADYINKRYATEAGLLEGTEPQDLNARLLSVAGVNTDVAKRYLREGGFYNKANYKNFADDVAEHPVTYLADNSAFGGVGMSFLKPFKSLFNTIGDITGIRTPADIHSEQVREQMFPEHLTEGIKTDFLGVNFANTMNSLANLGGYIAIASATGGLASGAGLSAAAAEHAGAWGSFGITSVDDGLKEADRMGLTPAQSMLYAGLKGVMMAEGGRLFEFGKFGVPTINGVKEKLAKAAIGISDGTLKDAAAKGALDDAGNLFIKGVKDFGISTVKGAGIMAGFGIGDSMLRLAFGDKSVNPDDVLPEAGNAFVQGLFTMGIMGSLGIKANIENAKNSTAKGMITKLAENPDASKDVLKIGLNQGLFSQAEYDSRMQVLNTAIRAKNAYDKTVEQTGVKPTAEQKSVWIANKTVEQVLRDAAAKPDLPEEEVNKLTEQADNLRKQGVETLDGLTFTKFLEPKYDLYHAATEYRQALDEHNQNPTADTEKKVLAKKDAYEKVASGAVRTETTTATVSQPEKAVSTLTPKQQLDDLLSEKLDSNKRMTLLPFEDPVTGDKGKELAGVQIRDLKKRHNILEGLIKCLT